MWNTFVYMQNLSRMKWRDIDSAFVFTCVPCHPSKCGLHTCIITLCKVGPSMNINRVFVNLSKHHFAVRWLTRNFGNGWVYIHGNGGSTVDLALLPLCVLDSKVDGYYLLFLLFLSVLCDWVENKGTYLLTQPTWIANQLFIYLSFLVKVKNIKVYRKPALVCESY